MKAPIAVAVAAILGMIVAGCQEGPVPIAPEDHGTPSSVKPAPENTLIPLHAVLRDPADPFNEFLELNGQVICKVTLVTSRTGRFYEVQTETEAVLTVLGSDYVSGKVSGTSTDRVNAPAAHADATAPQLTKTYEAAGRADGLRLNIRFNVSEKTLTLDTIWLSLPPKAGDEDEDA